MTATHPLLLLPSRFMSGRIEGKDWIESRIVRFFLLVVGDGGVSSGH